MIIPKTIFTKWYRWNDRKSVNNFDYPGVYILAKFKKVPSGNADTLDKNIIYIGETCDNSLKGRWYQFDRSAFQSKAGHSGGWSYNETFQDGGNDLYVAALPIINMPDNLRHLFIRFTERKLILNFALKYGKQPKLNKK